MADDAAIPTQQANDEIFMTAKAAEQVRKLKVENSIPEAHGLRLGVKGGGCSGLSYVLTVFVDPKSLFYLSGTELDFSDGLNGRGFVFNNPQAAKTCGCGSSFGV